MFPNLNTNERDPDPETISFRTSTYVKHLVFFFRSLGLGLLESAQNHSRATEADSFPYLGDSKNTVRGYCLDIPRFEESLKQQKTTFEEQGI